MTDKEKLIEIKLMLSRITDTKYMSEIHTIKLGTQAWMEGLISTDDFFESLLDMLVRLETNERGIRWS